MKQTAVLSKIHSGRILFALIVCVGLFVIGRNLYRRYLNNALINAVETRNVRAVRSLLDRGADANSALTFEDSKYKKYALYLAMDGSNASESAKIACMLIEHGANVHERMSNAHTYLQIACQGDSVALVRCLLEHGADPKEAPYYSTPVGMALESGRNNYGPARTAQRLRLSREMVDLLRQHGAQISLPQAVQLNDAALARQMLASGANVNQGDENRRTALEWAIRTDNLPLMQTLLERGANANASVSIGGTLLSLAANTGNTNAASLLLAHGAKVNMADTFSPPPLTTAVLANNLSIARLLLAHGADVNSKPKEYSLTALAAAVRSLPTFVPELLARGADINGAEGAALREAIRAHNPDMARYLLQHGAKIHPPHSHLVFTDPFGKPLLGLETTPSTLRVAVTDGPECFDLLMQAGADITLDKPDILLAAADAGHAMLFDRLIRLGANVNAQDVQGRTPITEALNHASAGVAILLEHGANPNVMALGRTPLMLATQQGNVGLVRLMLAHGANVNLKPLRSHTALYFAHRHQNGDMVRLLEQAGAKDE